MADTVEKKWLWPSSQPGNPREPGEKVPGYKKVKIQLTGLSDGTGETDVQKLDISELRTANGSVCTRTSITEIEYEVSGMNVLLEWDRAPHAVITRLIGAPSGASGTLYGPFVDESDGTDGTGDILLTSTGATSGDGYRITLTVELKGGNN